MAYYVAMYQHVITGGETYALVTAINRVQALRLASRFYPYPVSLFWELETIQPCDRTWVRTYRHDGDLGRLYRRSSAQQVWTH